MKHILLVLALSIFVSRPAPAADAELPLPTRESFTLTLDAITVTGGAQVTGTITLLRAAAEPELRVKLQSSAASVAPVPPEVFIRGRSTSTTFAVPTKNVLEVRPVQITASVLSDSKTVTLTLLPPRVMWIHLSPADTNGFFGGQTVGARLALNALAPAGGVPIPLSVTDTHTVPTCGQSPSVPATVWVNGGENSVDFQITTTSGKGVYRLSAFDKSVDLIVFEAALRSLVAPGSVKGGTTVGLKLQLSGVASTCGFGGHYKLRSSNPDLVQVPAEVTVPLGSSEVTVSITTSSVPALQVVSIFVTGHLYSYYGPPAFGETSKTLGLTP